MRLLAIAILLSGCVSAAPENPCGDVLSYGELVAIEQPAWGQRISYGQESLQFGELRVPAGEGPFPVVIVVHGGCWLSDFDMNHIRPLAAALTEAGYATWTPEYRRIGDSGGGWPNTFLDVAQAADKLMVIAVEHRLDLERVVAVGHSAGGHLALWLAARQRLPEAHPLFDGSDLLAVKGVVSLAGIPDLRQSADLRVCDDAVERLLQGSTGGLDESLYQGSPAHYLPLGVPQKVINGGCDPIVPATIAEQYAELAKASGDSVDLLVVGGVGHFELISPVSETWPVVLAAIEALAAE